MRDRVLFLLTITVLLCSLPALAGCSTPPLTARADQTPPPLPPDLDSPTDAPPSPSPAGPLLSLEPDSGGPRTRVAVVGRGFPGGTRVAIHLQGSRPEAKSASFGQAIADPTGALTLEFLVPSEWPGGLPITDKELSVVATADDGSTLAEASFAFQTDEPGLIGPTDMSTPTDESGLDAAAVQAAKDTASGFLNSLMKDPSGKSSVGYLAPNLKTKVQKGQTVPMLLGIQSIYPSFEIGTVQPGEDPDTAFVQAVLGLSPPAPRVLLLSRSSGAWKIADITAGQ